MPKNDILSNKFSNSFFFLGIIFFISASYLIWQRNTSLSLSFNIKELPSNSKTNEKLTTPKVLIIKDLKIKLPIISVQLKDGKWNYSSKGVLYLSSSPIPGEKGNSILYGHNWPNLLGNLTKAKPGQKISIIFADGKKKDFIIEYTSIVTPDQTHILNPSRDARITLYTCTGFLDSERLIVIAKPKTL